MFGFSQWRRWKKTDIGKLFSVDEDDEAPKDGTVTSLEHMSENSLLIPQAWQELYTKQLQIIQKIPIDANLHRLSVCTVNIVYTKGGFLFSTAHTLSSV